MRRNRAFFITFEGTEGAGKTTLIRAVESLLQTYGIKLIKTREPGGVPLAETLRTLILNEAMAPKTELFLYEAARVEHLEHVVLPALEKGIWVLCDRFTDSTVAYQGSARGVPRHEIEAANRIATSGLKPDLTVLLKIDPSIGLARAKEITRFEREGLAFQKKVLKGFLTSARVEPKRWFVLPVQEKVKGEWVWLSPQALAEKVVDEIFRRLLKQKRKRA